mmetsp:Transcript_5751/g.14716  ORF Transcript_5751/g.14716 Transcript_5751/m.14716 type:complete len:252 (+) Transcript_5751:369-1124(+)
MHSASSSILRVLSTFCTPADARKAMDSSDDSSSRSSRSIPPARFTSAAPPMSARLTRADRPTCTRCACALVSTVLSRRTSGRIGSSCATVRSSGRQSASSASDSSVASLSTAAFVSVDVSQAERSRVAIAVSSSTRSAGRGGTSPPSAPSSTSARSSARSRHCSACSTRTPSRRRAADWSTTAARHRVSKSSASAFTRASRACCNDCSERGDHFRGFHERALEADEAEGDEGCPCDARRSSAVRSAAIRAL